MEKCNECARYHLEIQNLQQGLRLAKDEARAAQVQGPREELRDQFGLMLNLAYRLDEARKKYERHRTAHSILN